MNWFADTSSQFDKYSSDSTDILVIGGGLVGSAVAYFLKTKTDNRSIQSVTVVERDPTVSDKKGTLSESYMALS